VYSDAVIRRRGTRSGTFHAGARKTAARYVRGRLLNGGFPDGLLTSPHNGEVRMRLPKNSDFGENKDKWAGHEHVADAAQIAAQRLVDAAGSVELAKQALANTKEPTETSSDAPAASADSFAQQHGFGSYLELFEAAEPITDASQGVWMLAACRSGYMAWSEREYAAVRFADRAEAVAAIESGSLGVGGRPAK
jgi:hypothetical protein